MPAVVDPRDTRWEQSSPIYRVYFWHRPPAESGTDQERMMWHCQEWRLTEAADVHEVLAWANGPDGRGRMFELFVEASDSHGLGLLRLAGTSPVPLAGTSPTDPERR
jgi:hypothetical protein